MSDLQPGASSSAGAVLEDGSNVSEAIEHSLIKHLIVDYDSLKVLTTKEFLDLNATPVAIAGKELRTTLVPQLVCEAFLRNDSFRKFEQDVCVHSVLDNEDDGVFEAGMQGNTLTFMMQMLWQVIVVITR